MVCDSAETVGVGAVVRCADHPQSKMLFGEERLTVGTFIE